jgi:hypothetical protein
MLSTTPFINLFPIDSHRIPVVDILIPKEEKNGNKKESLVQAALESNPTNPNRFYKQYLACSFASGHSASP